MALLATGYRLQRNPHCGWITIIRPFKTGEPCRLPDIPYWRGEEKKVQVKSFDEIPGPKPVFFLGNIWRYWPVVGQFSFVKLHETYLSFFKQYGYVVKEKVHPTRTIVHAYHPEDIMSVFNSSIKYPLRRSHTAMEKYRRERPHLYSSAGLGASNGEEWRAFRKLFLKLGSNEIIVSHRPNVEMVTDELVEKLGRGLNWKSEIDVRQPLFRWALETVGVITLNQRLGCLDSETNPEADRLIKAAHTTHDAIYRVENHMSPLVRWREYRRLVEAQDFFSEVIRKYMHQTLEDYSPEKGMSLLTLFMNSEEREITTKDVFTLILDLFQGGIHSVSYSICFALLHLAMNKDKQDKLRALLIERLPTQSSLMSTAPGPVPYLNYVVKESLRLSPPSIGTGRILGRDLVLGGYDVPAGTMVILHNQISARLPEFFKDPHAFIPERFSEAKDLGITDNVGKYANIPFGFGRRSCIGNGFAMMEMRLAIAKIVRKYEISYHYEPVGIVNKLHNEPDRPVLLRFKKIEH